VGQIVEGLRLDASLGESDADPVLLRQRIHPLAERGGGTNARTVQGATAAFGYLFNEWYGEEHERVKRQTAEYYRRIGWIVQTEVPFDMYREGVEYSARADVVVMKPGSGYLQVIDVKTGPNAGLADDQKYVYPGLVEGYNVTSWGPKIEAFGFQSGEPLPSAHVAIDYRRFPGAMQEVYIVPGGKYPYDWKPKQ